MESYRQKSSPSTAVQLLVIGASGDEIEARQGETRGHDVTSHGVTQCGLCVNLVEELHCLLELSFGLEVRGALNHQGRGCSQGKPS